MVGAVERASQANPRLERDCVTLSRHVLEQLQSFDPNAQDLAALLNRVGLAGKLIARHLSQAGLLEDLLGVTGETNIQGEAVKHMDVFANQAFIAVFRQSGLVCRLASEEMDRPFYITENCPISRLCLVFDPIDGSTNLDINLNLGSIFAVRRMTASDESSEAEDLLQPGRSQVAAGYILYGPATQLVYTLGQGVHVFTLDPSLGEFILTAEHVRIPEQGKIYSVNEGNFWQWSPPYQEFVRYVQQHAGYSARYSGALVADLHRILIQGGVFLYPETTQHPQGKLRLLYEAAPMALLIEQAGGRATDGQQPILDRVGESLHGRTPLVIGSPGTVALVETFLRGEALQ
jgi:fructose-1,6-bisphosphatase I